MKLQVADVRTRLVTYDVWHPPPAKMDQPGETHQIEILTENLVNTVYFSRIMSFGTVLAYTCGICYYLAFLVTL